MRHRICPWDRTMKHKYSSWGNRLFLSKNKCLSTDRHYYPSLKFVSQAWWSTFVVHCTVKLIVVPGSLC